MFFHNFALMKETLHQMRGRILLRLRSFFSRPFFHDRRTIAGLWVLLSAVAMMLKWNPSNNFRIFRGVFWHTVRRLPLYEAYPSEYFDVNHYGPLFSLVVAPFALVPYRLGLLSWLVALSLSLFAAVSRSGFSHRKQMFIFWFCSQTLLTSLFMQQFNIAIAALLIASFSLVERKKEFWAALLIVAGTLVKLYGVVGLAFFFFSRHKGKFVLSLLFWAVALFILPMLVSSPEYVVTQYKEWYICLTEKNTENINSVAQNISALGLFRRISGNVHYSDLWIILPALMLFFVPYLRFSQYQHVAFRQTMLASVLLFVVLFSTGSESSSYVISISGVCVWYLSAPWKRNGWDVFLLVFVFLLSGLGNSDLYPRVIRRELIQEYALKALPCFLVWLKLCCEMAFRDYSPVCASKQNGEAES